MSNVKLQSRIKTVGVLTTVVAPKVQSSVSQTVVYSVDKNTGGGTDTEYY